MKQGYVHPRDFPELEAEAALRLSIAAREEAKRLQPGAPPVLTSGTALAMLRTAIVAFYASLLTDPQIGGVTPEKERVFRQQIIEGLALDLGGMVDTMRPTHPGLQEPGEATR